VTAEPDAPFEEPWQARAFATAVVVVDETGLPWDAFRARLKAAIAADPDRPYWDSWVVALDDIVAALRQNGEERLPPSA